MSIIICSDNFREVKKEDIKKLADEEEMLSFEISAKLGDNVSHVFSNLFTLRPPQPGDGETVYEETKISLDENANCWC